MKKLIPIMILFSLSTGSQAELPDTYGVGQDLCEKYLEQKQVHDMRPVYMAWIQGYVSGAEMFIFSAHDDAKFTSSDINEMSTFVDAYCSEHPYETVLNATDKLVRKLVINE